jgi:hypothetical protein
MLSETIINNPAADCDGDQLFGKKLIGASSRQQEDRRENSKNK